VGRSSSRSSGFAATGSPRPGSFPRASRHVGLASGVILGVSVGLGGLISAGLGLLADATSLETALYAVAGLPAIAFGLGLTLPEPDR